MNIATSSSTSQELARDGPSTHATGCLVTAHDKVCFWCHKEGEDLREFNTHAEVEPIGTAPRVSMKNIPGVCDLDELPPVLFRWSNVNSQGINSRYLYRAGKFSSTESEYFGPGELSHDEFLEYFRSHVRKEKRPTPFISSFALPLAPIHRALHNPEGAIVSIIDPSKLDTPVVSARPLVPLTNTATWSWKGYGEYLIWGQVSTPAIVCTFTVTSLMDIASTHEDMQQFLQIPLIQSYPSCNSNLHNALSQISLAGEYDNILERLARLLGVPQEYQEVVAQKFKEAWTLRISSRSQIGSDTDNGEIERLSCNPNLLGRTQGTEGGSDTSEYLPPPPTNDGSRDESVDEEDRASDESSEAPCPRHDTPDDGQFSVHDDSTACSGRWKPLTLLTPPNSGQRDRVLKWAQQVPKPIPFTLNRNVPEDTEMEEGWPPSDEGMIDTPTRPSVSLLNNKSARTAFFKRFEMGS